MAKTEAVTRNGNKVLVRPSVLDALEAATPDDLEDVDREIVAVQQRLDTLRTVQRLLRVKFHGRAGKKKGGGEGGRGAMTKDRRVTVAKYLIHAGATRPAALAKACNIPDGSMTALLAHPWFEAGPSGVVLSREGQAAVGAAKP